MITNMTGNMNSDLPKEYSEQKVPPEPLLAVPQPSMLDNAVIYPEHGSSEEKKEGGLES